MEDIIELDENLNEISKQISLKDFDNENISLLVSSLTNGGYVNIDDFKVCETMVSNLQNLKNKHKGVVIAGNSPWLISLMPLF